jgi:hypothetical protein
MHYTLFFGSERSDQTKLAEERGRRRTTTRISSSFLINRSGSASATEKNNFSAEGLTSAPFAAFCSQAGLPTG